LIIRSAFEVHTACIVNEAQDGADAVAKAKTFNPDLVVMDLSMPGMHGLEATRRLKKEHGPVQVILFTGHENILPQSDAEQAGLDAVVSKSEGMEILLQRAEQLLTTSHSVNH
jgi:DNA-binding NarL/FixJ family response regulator